MRKIYSEAAIEHGMNPRNLGDMDNADGFGRVTVPAAIPWKYGLK
jgi:NifU-like protein involved in Fe-S cluster formation